MPTSNSNVHVCICVHHPSIHIPSFIFIFIIFITYLHLHLCAAHPTHTIAHIDRHLHQRMHRHTCMHARTHTNTFAHARVQSCTHLGMPAHMQAWMRRHANTNAAKPIKDGPLARGAQRGHHVPHQRLQLRLPQRGLRGTPPGRGLVVRAGGEGHRVRHGRRAGKRAGGRVDLGQREGRKLTTYAHQRSCLHRADQNMVDKNVGKRYLSQRRFPAPSSRSSHLHLALH